MKKHKVTPSVTVTPRHLPHRGRLICSQVAIKDTNLPLPSSLRMPPYSFGSQNRFSAWSAERFWPLRHFALASSSTGRASAAMPKAGTKKQQPFGYCLFSMVEATGLEPAASCSQSRHSTKLSYASNCFAIIHSKPVIVKTFIFCNRCFFIQIKKTLRFVRKS